MQISPPQRALILAAGRGCRLQEVFPDRPKGLLVLDGLPIIERSIRQIRRTGIHDITLVTGYAAEHYRVLQQREPGLRLVHNPYFATSGSLYSLCCPQAVIQPPFLLLESDLVYEQRALTELLHFPRPNGLLMSGFTYSDDEVFISTAGPRVLQLSKNRAALMQVSGELVGIATISAPMYEAIQTFATASAAHTQPLSYEDGINAITRDLDVFYHLVPDLIWAEIDTPAHLQRVKNLILPRLGAVEPFVIPVQEPIDV